jgi:hypothetical protein
VQVNKVIAAYYENFEDERVEQVMGDVLDRLEEAAV